MAGPRSILYANFHPCAGNAMFRRRLDGIRRFARGLGLEVATLGADDCGPDGVTEALERLRPAGCIAESANLSPRMFGCIPAVFFDPPDARKWIDVPDFGGRYDAQLIDFARMVRGETENPFGYDHELAVERTLLRACGVPFVEQR